MLKLGELVAILGAEVDQLKEDMGKAKKVWDDHGEQVKTAALAIGAAGAAAIGAGLLASLDVSAAMSKFTAQLGDTEYAKELGEVAGRMYNQGLGQSLEESMAAVRSVMSSGLLDEDAANEEIQSVSTKAMALADVFEIDVTAAARTAGQMVKSGMAKDAAEAFDLLVRGFRQTGDLAGDLTDTFDEYSTEFRALGLSGAQSMGLLSQGAKGSARDLDTVADALKEYAIRSKDGSKTTIDGFKSLGLNAKQMTADMAAGGDRAAGGLDKVLDKLRGVKDPAEQSRIAVELFGTKAEDLQKALYDLDPSKAEAALGDVKGAADKMTEAVGEDPKAKLEGFKREIQGALVDKMGEAVPHIESAVNWLRQHKDTIEPLMPIVYGLAGALTALAVANAIYSAGQWLANLALLAFPATWIILGIMSIVAGIWLLWTKCDGFRNGIKAIWNFLKEAFLGWWHAFSGMWTAIGDALVTGVKKWWDLFTGFWGGVKDGIVEAAKWVKDKVGSIIDFFHDLPGNLKKAGSAAFEWMSDKAEEAKGWVVEKFDGMVKFVRELPGKIRDAAGDLFGGVKDSFKSAVNWIIGKWNDMEFGIGGKEILGVSIPGGKLETHNIPMLYQGGTLMDGGWAMVGDRGPELIRAPGATVRPLDSRSPAPGGGSMSVSGEIVVRGTGLLAGVRETVRATGTSLDAVLVGGAGAL
jgi:phage-related minor tail protein